MHFYGSLFKTLVKAIERKRKTDKREELNYAHKCYSLIRHMSNLLHLQVRAQQVPCLTVQGKGKIPWASALLDIIACQARIQAHSSTQTSSKTIRQL